MNSTKNKSSPLPLALAVVLAMGLGAQTAQATTVTLGSLIASDGSLTVDDKIFSKFTFSETGLAMPSSANDINVTATQLDSLHDQLTFSGAFGDLGRVAGSSDFLIGYTVATTNGAPLIHDIALSFNGVVISPTASATVTETAVTGLNNVVGQVFVNTPNNLSTTPLNLTGGPFASISVQKDIQLNWDAGGIVQISTINQVVSQTPEPMSLLLFGSGLAGLRLLGRRAPGAR